MRISFIQIREKVSHFGFMCLVAVSVIGYTAIPKNVFSEIVNGQNAIDILGQYTETSTYTPSYTKNGIYNTVADRSFNSPRFILIDSINHRLFVSESSSNRVLVFNLNSSNQLVDKVADYVLGQPDFGTTSSGSTQSKLNDPYGLAYDSTNSRLFVAEASGNRVKVFDVASIINGEDAVAVLGQTTYTGASPANTQSGLRNPYGLAYDSTNSRLFVAESLGNRVKVFDVASITNGENATAVLGQATYTGASSANAQAGLSFPVSLAYDSTNSRLFVAEGTGNRVKVFDVASITNGENATAILGQSTYTGATAADTQAGLNLPQGLVYDSVTTRLFVSEGTGNRVKVFDVASITNGENATAILGQSTYTGATAADTQAGLRNPYGLAYDSTNSRLFVAETSGNRVKVFDVTSITNGENAVDLVGQYTNSTDFTVSYTKAGTYNIPEAYATGFISPRVVLVDSVSHRLFVADSGNRILVFNLNSSNQLVDKVADYVLGQPDFQTIVSATTQAGMFTPSGLAYDATNSRLFVAETSGNRVKVFDVASITNGEDAVAVLGQSTYTDATAVDTQAGLNSPQGLVYDSVTTRLFVSEGTGNRVKVFDVASITNGENATAVLGQATYTGATAADTQAGLNNPIGLAYDSTNSRLFVAETSGNRVKVFDVASITNGEDAVAVLGQSTYTGSTSGNTQSEFNTPRSLAYDSINSRLFVAEGGGNRVKVFDVASITNGENATAVLGQATYTGATAADTQAGLRSPYGLAYDSTNSRLFVTEFTSANRVKVFDVDPTDYTAPIISSIATSTTSTTATISWATSESATSTLDYGLTELYGSSTSTSATSTSHSYILTDLMTETTYNFRISVADSSGNIATSTNLTFTTPDGESPVISSVASSTTSTTGTVTWNTDEAASSRAVYSIDTTYGSTTDTFDTSPRVLSHSIDITDLLACTLYNFKVVSADAIGNTSTSTAYTFLTTGCVGGESPQSTETTEVTVVSGGVASTTFETSSLEITAPSNFTSTSSAVTFQIKVLASSAVIDSIGTPSGLTLAGDIVFDVSSYIDSVTSLDTFDQPLTVSYTYSDADIVGLDESTLKLYHYHNGVWEQLTGCSVNTSTNTITCTTTSFSIFALFGSAPVAQSESSGGSSHIAYSTGGSTTYYGCRDARASNYESWASHKQDLCRYAQSSASQSTTIQTSSTIPPIFLFTRNLSFGVKGNDVRQLQQYLNARGFVVASSGPGSLGAETTYFGKATQRALINFQKAKSITPAVGFFGPVTRGVINSK